MILFEKSFAKFTHFTSSVYKEGTSTKIKSFSDENNIRLQQNAIDVIGPVV